MFGEQGRKPCKPKPVEGAKMGFEGFRIIYFIARRTLGWKGFTYSILISSHRKFSRCENLKNDSEVGLCL
ncbi:hypothetical protein Y032_0162g3425 [Ancylostoma ceylanicum]|uniref:Uncharacterized protein n=1 Tax=Ancylostoma ceylanicum TaxID=53326 RepID=A0A016SXM0_9BILA|nr:hypothetical protein Y032_0162g3425 [Ancylostoma ceylanicum]